MYAWNLQPGLLLVLGLLGIGYWVATGPLQQYFAGSAPVSSWQKQLFGLGWLALFAALVSPIESLTGYSLTLHMVQHLLLTLVSPPLLLKGTPGWLLRPVLRIPGLFEIARFLSGPVTAFIIYNVVFSLWHVPKFYELTLNSEPFHILEHAMFFMAGILAWWPICSPLDELPPVKPGVAVVFLFLQSIPATILGAILTFASEPLYRSYTRGPFLWGMTPLTDQQLAGLLMWVPGSLLFLGVLGVIFIRWLDHDDYETGIPQKV